MSVCPGIKYTILSTNIRQTPSLQDLLHTVIIANNNYIWCIIVSHKQRKYLSCIVIYLYRILKVIGIINLINHKILLIKQ